MIDPFGQVCHHGFDATTCSQCIRAAGVKKEPMKTLYDLIDSLPSRWTMKLFFYSPKDLVAPVMRVEIFDADKAMVVYEKRLIDLDLTDIIERIKIMEGAP